MARNAVTEKESISVKIGSTCVTDGRALEARKCGHGRVEARNGAPPNAAESLP